MNWLKKNLSTILLVLALIIGLCLLLYPTVSDYWNSFHQSRAIATYAEQIAQIDNTHYIELLQGAEAYNAALARQEKANWVLSEEELEAYNTTLDVSGAGIMCSLEIPKLKCKLAVYHGVDEGVLQIAVGHIPGSSLPVGGESTHCVLSGHRGLPSARLLTDLDKLVVGDTFLINVLDEILTYEVDQILIVEPQELDALAIEEGKDYCTLVTCTPYGINTHRLLVRGHRVANAEEAVQIRVTADALQIEPVLVAPLVAVPMLLILLVRLLLSTRKKRR